MTLENHPYAPFLHRVLKPARYVGGEYQQIVKDPSEVRVRMALAFPDVYDIGMSHLGTKILYAIVNRHPGLAAERVFCPWVDMERELRARDLPLLSLETARPLTAFDVVGFSLQYELTYTNILTMLDLAGIPFRSADRDETHPLIIAGGPVATQPEPMAPFIDLFLIGDAEEKLPELLVKLGELKTQGASRRHVLVELAKLGGLYAPALYTTRLDERSGFVVVDRPTEAGVPERPKRVILDDLNRYPFPDDSPVAAAEAIFDRMSVEIARGCTEGCRFCQAGMIYRPVRERDPETVVETLVSAIRKGGYDEASMTTLSTADYSCISPLIKRVMERLREEKVSLSVASLRAYGLDEATLDEIKSVRMNGLTFAPEAGTQRMRDVINKNVSEEDLQQTGHRVFSRGWRRMKLYFMIGLPTETDEDVAGIMETGHRMKEIGYGYHRRAADVTVSVSSHVPKPHTPFQWAAMDSIEEIERKQEILRDLSRRYRLEYRRHDPRASFLECVLGRGDRRMADLVEAAWRRGARFDSWDDQLAWDAWMEALAERDDIPYEAFTGTIAVDAALPWDHLDIQVEKAFLLRDYRRAMKDRLSPPCGKPAGAQVHHTNLEEHEADARILVCYHCGVACDMERMREERGEFLTKLGALRPADDALGRANGDAAEVATEFDAAPAAPAAPASEGAAPAARPATGRTARRKPRPAFHQETRARYRIGFAKTGPAVLTGHLDFVRTFPRIVRRAGFTAWYSEGFHPKPVMEFSPPLPLGVAGLDEVVELHLAEDVSPTELLRKLRAAAPEGIRFHAAHRVIEGVAKLSRLLDAAETVLRLDPAVLDRAGLTPDALRAAPERFLARADAPLEVLRKDASKTLDVRAAVDDVRWVDAEETEGTFASGGPFLRVRLLLRAADFVRPEEAAAAVLGIDPEVGPDGMVRTRLLRRGPDGWLPVLPRDEAAELSASVR